MTSQLTDCVADAQALAEAAATSGLAGEALGAQVEALRRRLESLEAAANEADSRRRPPPPPEEQTAAEPSVQSKPQAPEPVTIAPIAHIRSPYKRRHGTPRQAVVGDDGGGEPDAELVLCDDINPEALTGLDGFDYAWLITDFNRNRQLGLNHHGGHWKPMVRPPPSLTFDGSVGRAGMDASLPAGLEPDATLALPRAGSRSRRAPVRIGILATRSPDHPNKLGLSAVRVLSVDTTKGVVQLRGVDLLDGTPVLDVKPYLAYADSFPEARQGWTVYPSPSQPQAEAQISFADDSNTAL